MLMLLVVWALSVATVLLLVGVAIVGAWLYSCGQRGETPKIIVPRWGMSRSANGKAPPRKEDERLPAV